MSELFARIDYERRAPRPETLRLEPMRALLSRLGNPHQNAPVLHVAGTKGKGSVAAMLGAVLAAQGMRTGVYSSPHLERLNERFSINGHPVGDDELAQSLEIVLSHARLADAAAQTSGLPPLTFFEITTAVAFLHFARQNANVTVLETGLGGRLDSTNVCDPVLSIITSISLDHTRTLGETLEKIAFEKAGIIKPGRPVISGVREPESVGVIRRKAKECRSSLIQIDEDFDWSTSPDGTIRVAGRVGQRDFVWHSLEIGLQGQHQKHNAALAVAATEMLRHLGWSIDDASVLSGLANVRLAGRFEQVCDRPLVVLDVAHNPASIDAFCQTFDDQWNRRERASTGCRTLVVSISRDKDAEPMVRRLSQSFDRIIVTQFHSNPRARDAKSLAVMFSKSVTQLQRAVDVRIEADPVAAWQTAIQGSRPTDAIAVTGSTFLVGELRAPVKESVGRIASKP